MADCGPSATRDEGESGCAFPAARPSADPHSSAAAASLKAVDGQITVLLQCQSCCMCSRQWPLVAGAASDAWAWHWPTVPLDAGENEERTFIESNGHGPQAEPHAVHVLADGAFSGLLEQSKAFLALDAKLRQLQDDVDQNKAMATLVARLEKQGKEFETSTSRRMASAEIRLAESEAKVKTCQSAVRAERESSNSLQKKHQDMATMGMLSSSMELCMNSVDDKFAKWFAQHDARLGACEAGLVLCARLADYEKLRERLDAMLAADYLVDVKELRAQLFTMSEQLQELLGAAHGTQDEQMQYLVDEVSGIKLKLGLLGMNIDDVVAVHDGLATQLDFLSLKSSFENWQGHLELLQKFHDHEHLQISSRLEMVELRLMRSPY